MSNAKKMFTNYLQNPPRRSGEFLEGVRASLAWQCGETARLTCPYEPGSAESDAFYSGTEEGYRVFRTS